MTIEFARAKRAALRALCQLQSQPDDIAVDAVHFANTDLGFQMTFTYGDWHKRHTISYASLSKLRGEVFDVYIANAVRLCLLEISACA